MKEPRHVGYCPTKGPRKRAGLDKERKVKRKGMGGGKGNRKDGREAKETQVDKTPRLSSNQGQETVLRMRGTGFVLQVSLMR